MNELWMFQYVWHGVFLSFLQYLLLIFFLPPFFHFLMCVNVCFFSSSLCLFETGCNALFYIFDEILLNLCFFSNSCFVNFSCRIRVWSDMLCSAESAHNAPYISAIQIEFSRDVIWLSQLKMTHKKHTHTKINVLICLSVTSFRYGHAVRTKRCAHLTWHNHIYLIL